MATPTEAEELKCPDLELNVLEQQNGFNQAASAAADAFFKK